MRMIIIKQLNKDSDNRRMSKIKIFLVALVCKNPRFHSPLALPRGKLTFGILSNGLVADKQPQHSAGPLQRVS